MSKPVNLAAVPRSRKLQNMSNPQLVALIRRQTKERIIHKLTHNGQEYRFWPMLSEAIAEAKRRRLTIVNPETQEEIT